MWYLAVKNSCIGPVSLNLVKSVLIVSFCSLEKSTESNSH